MICIAEAGDKVEATRAMADEVNINPIFRERRTIRRYRPDPLPRLLLDQLLTAAIWAPSAHNRQPARFAVVQDAALKERLAQTMGDQLRRDLAADGLSPDSIEADASRSYMRITSAPVAIVLCLTLADMDVYADARRSQNEFLMAVQSAALAGQNLLLAAHDAGLGACWMCAPLFVQADVREVLALPEDWQPQSLITLGYPAETRQKTRKPLEASVIWR